MVFIRVRWWHFTTRGACELRSEIVYSREAIDVVSFREELSSRGMIVVSVEVL